MYERLLWEVLDEHIPVKQSKKKKKKKKKKKERKDNEKKKKKKKTTKKQQQCSIYEQWHVYEYKL